VHPLHKPQAGQTPAPCSTLTLPLCHAKDAAPSSKGPGSRHILLQLPMQANRLLPCQLYPTLGGLSVGRLPAQNQGWACVGTHGSSPTHSTGDTATAGVPVCACIIRHLWEGGHEPALFTAMAGHP
jgi:hypothetical protein